MEKEQRMALCCLLLMMFLECQNKQKKCLRSLIEYDESSSSDSSDSDQSSSYSDIYDSEDDSSNFSDSDEEELLQYLHVGSTYVSARDMIKKTKDPRMVYKTKKKQRISSIGLMQ